MYKHDLYKKKVFLSLYVLLKQTPKLSLMKKKIRLKGVSHCYLELSWFWVFSVWNLLPSVINSFISITFLTYIVKFWVTIYQCRLSVVRRRRVWHLKNSFKFTCRKYFPGISRKHFLMQLTFDVLSLSK